MEQINTEIVCGSFDDHKNYFVSKNYEKKKYNKSQDTENIKRRNI